MTPFLGPEAAALERGNEELWKRALGIALEAKKERAGDPGESDKEFVRKELIRHLIEEDKWLGESASLTFFEDDEGRKRIFLEIPNCPLLELRINVGVLGLLDEIREIKDGIMFSKNPLYPIGFIGLSHEEFRELLRFWVEEKDKTPRKGKRMDVEDEKFQSRLGMEIINNLKRQSEILAAYSHGVRDGEVEGDYMKIAGALRSILERKGYVINGERSRDVRGKLLLLLEGDRS